MESSMKHLLPFAIISLLSLLSACGGGSYSPSWPDHSVAPDAALVDPIDDLFGMDTESDRFGVGFYGSDQIVSIGYAHASGDKWTWFSSASAEANDPFEASELENPTPGLLYVYAVGVWGTEYLTLVQYEPGVNDGCYLSRNNMWLEAP